MSKPVQSPKSAATRPSLTHLSRGEVNPHKATIDQIVAQTPFFDFYRVVTPHRMAQVAHLRYEVYCEERRFLPTEDYPDAQEHDEYDGCSVHFLGCHRNSGLAAGTVRLVLASPLGFPMMSHCEVDEAHAFMVDRREERQLYYGEVSRVAVSKRYSQRTGDTPFGGLPRASNVHLLTHAPVPEFPGTAGPGIVAGLYKSIYQEARLRGLTHLLAAMERSLTALLRRMCIHFTPIGPLRNYYGPVRPHVVPVSQMELDLLRKRPEVLRYWLSGLPRLLLPPIAGLVEAVLADRADELAEIEAATRA